MSARHEVAEFGPRDVTTAARARGESQREAMDQFNAQCWAAIRSDPELHREYVHAELMAAYSAENVPPSYGRAEMDDWVRAPATEPSRTAQLEAQLAELDRAIERDDQDREIGE